MNVNWFMETAAWTHHQWCTQGHGVFWVSAVQTPSPGRPSWGWSDPGLCPSSVLLHASPLLIHNHLEGFRAASLMFLEAFLSSNPLMSRSLSARCRLALETLCSPPRSAHSGPSNCWLCRPDVYFAGFQCRRWMNAVLTHVMSLSSPWRSQRHPVTDVAVTVRSSIKARSVPWSSLERGWSGCHMLVWYGSICVGRV